MNESIEQLKELLGELGTIQSPGSSVKRGWTYHPIPFVEFSSVPCHRREATVQRWKAITEAVQFEDKFVIDIGCSVGYFSFSAMLEGATVMGIEKDPVALRVCNALFNHYKNSRNLNGYFLNAVPETLPPSDVTLAMSVLNWIGKTKSEEILASLTSKVLISEMPLRGDGMQGAQWLQTEKEFTEWIRKHYLSRATKLLETMGPGGRIRTLWKFTKE